MDEGAFWIPLHSYCALITRWGEDREREACGLIIDMRGGQDRVVRMMRNVSDSPRERFELDPVELRVAFEQEKEERLKIVGMWHTHPETDAVPSERDRRNFRVGGWAYVIVGCAKGGGAEVRCWDFVGVKDRPEERMINVSLYKPVV